MNLKADVSEQEKQLFYEYYLENVKNQNASIMLADLTHDSTEEMILIDFNEAGEKIRYIYEHEEYRTMMPGNDLEAEDAKLRRISDAALVYEEASLPLVRVGERFRSKTIRKGSFTFL